MSRKLFATVDGLRIEISERERILASVASATLRMSGDSYQDTQRLTFALKDRVPALEFASKDTLERLVQQIAGETVPLTIIED